MEAIQFKHLAPGDRTIIDDKMETVRGLSFGDGLVAFNGATAKPVVVEFNSGLTIRQHPQNYIDVMRSDVDGAPRLGWLSRVTSAIRGFAFSNSKPVAGN